MQITTSGVNHSMSALGQKQTSERIRAMSALPPKADIDHYGRDVRFVPKADCVAAKMSLFDHLVEPAFIKRLRNCRTRSHNRFADTD